MDVKVILKFIADLLYLKGYICYQEYNDILSCNCCEDLDFIVEKNIRGVYNVYVQGEIE